MKKERRKYTRYKIENAVSINPEGVYQLVDISEGGFCFKCHPNSLFPEKWVTDIINSVVHLDEFPTTKIWVSLYKNGQCNIPALMLVGAKFNKLKKDQKSKLLQLIRSASAN